MKIFEKHVISVPKVTSLVRFWSSLGEEQCLHILNSIVVCLLMRWGVYEAEAFVDLLQGNTKSWKIEVISLYDFWEMVGLKELEALGPWCNLGLPTVHINTGWRQEIWFTSFLQPGLQLQTSIILFQRELFQVAKTDDCVFHYKVPQHKNLSGTTALNMLWWGFLLSRLWQLSGQASELAWRGSAVAYGVEITSSSRSPRGQKTVGIRCETERC